LLGTHNVNEQQDCILSSPHLSNSCLSRTESPSFGLAKFKDYDENEALVVVDIVNKQTNLNEEEITSIEELCKSSYTLNRNNAMSVDNVIENDRKASFTEENAALEEWNRKSLKQRKSCSYLFPNPHLKHLNLKNSNKIQSLPTLKNGSRFQDLKSSRTVNKTDRIVLSNTCAFDGLSLILMASNNNCWNNFIFLIKKCV